jgi:hypothetical protein
VPLKPSELGDFVGMLSQLRLMVANLAAQGQWHGGSAERPASRVKVRAAAWVQSVCAAACARDWCVPFFSHLPAFMHLLLWLAAVPAYLP